MSNNPTQIEQQDILINKIYAEIDKKDAFFNDIKMTMKTSRLPEDMKAEVLGVVENQNVIFHSLAVVMGSFIVNAVLDEKKTQIFNNSLIALEYIVKVTDSVMGDLADEYIKRAEQAKKQRVLQ